MITTSRYVLRAMTEADIDQVAEIESESFPTTWPHTAYRRELSNRMARYLVVVDQEHRQVEPKEPARRSLMRIWKREDAVAPTTDYIVGYIGLWLMVDEAHVVAIAVRHAYRRQGLGDLLLAEAIELAIQNHQETVSLEVRISNQIAQALYEKYRFLKVGVRRRYYSDNNEDAIIMSTPPIQDRGYLSLLAYNKEALEKRWREAES